MKSPQELQIFETDEFGWWLNFRILMLLTNSTTISLRPALSCSLFNRVTLERHFISDKLVL